MIDDNRTAKGRPIGTNVHEAYKSNSKIKFVSSPFPIKSSMYFHKNCISKIKITIEKVLKNGFIKAIVIDLLSFFKINF